MIVGVLTSSRADYGIYKPLLSLLKSDSSIELKILAFGTHLSDKFGKTVNGIKDDGFIVTHEIETFPESDSPRDISVSMAKTIEKFSQIWENESFDLVFALGDRYEMFAAVASTVPFNIPIAHIHGGETTLGAIDNAFRHSITSMSSYHFTAAEPYKQRVIQILGHDNNVFNVGALSIDLLRNMVFLSQHEFNERYGIDISKPTVLITFHPETINFEENKKHIKELILVLTELKNYQQVITMPNADTMGQLIRESLLKYAKNKSWVFCVESFGSLGYLSCMKHCSFLLGNTSSGFIEASFFAKPVINLGCRQKGRIVTPNIFSVKIDHLTIKKTITLVEKTAIPSKKQVYGDGSAALQITTIIKKEFKTK